MRTQEGRDEVTLVIATALLRFLAVLAGGLLALFLGWALVGGEWFVEATVWPLCVLAGVVAVVHLYGKPASLEASAHAALRATGA